MEDKLVNLGFCRCCADHKEEIVESSESMMPGMHLHFEQFAFCSVECRDAFKEYLRLIKVARETAEAQEAVWHKSINYDIANEFLRNFFEKRKKKAPALV